MKGDKRGAAYGIWGSWKRTLHCSPCEPNTYSLFLSFLPALPLSLFPPPALPLPNTHISPPLRSCPAGPR